MKQSPFKGINACGLDLAKQINLKSNMFIKNLIKQFKNHYDMFVEVVDKKHENINDYFRLFLLELSDVRVLLNDNSTWDYVFDVLNQNRGFAS